jgi:A/G-specific adenine glycosylase
MLSEDIPALQAALLAWFDLNQRPMPFRETVDPYAIWVSEIMLQQTTVAAATPYWQRFMKRFSTVHSLADAPLDDVLHAWSGLGYYSRARNMHTAAKAIVERHGGVFPRRFNDVLALPGIGRYTAGAVCSFAYNDDVPVVDANVARVLTRLLLTEGDPRSPATHKALWERAAKLLPHGHARKWNLALFDIGATVCTPVDPRCGECPLSPWCGVRIEGRQTEFPQLAPKPPMERQTDVGLVVRDNTSRILLLQRPPTGVWAGMWEVPRGTVEGGESMVEAAQRIALERLGAGVTMGREIATVRHTVMRRSITLRAFEATPLGVVDAGRWVTHEEAATLALPSPQRKLLLKLSL